MTSADSGAGRSEGPRDREAKEQPRDGLGAQRVPGLGSASCPDTDERPTLRQPLPTAGVAASRRVTWDTVGTVRPGLPGQASVASAIKAPAEASGRGDWGPRGPALADRPTDSALCPPAVLPAMGRGRVGAGRAAAVPRTPSPPGAALC